MNDYLLALILGVVEGLTEFLPVSSTAHIRLVLALIGGADIMKDDYWKMFSVTIQFGAILAVVIYFWRQLMHYLRTFPRGATGERRWWNHPISLVLVAFIVTAIPAKLLSRAIKENLESLWVMGAALVVGAIIMWVVDVVMRRPRTEQTEKMTLPQAVVVGIAQIFSAIFPGTSRSMSTIAGGQLAGLSRHAALEFSFLLSIPTMFAACAYDLYKSLSVDTSTPGLMADPMNTARWIQLAIGLVTSFIVAWGVIAWFMNWVRRHGFIPFAIYRIIIGLVVLAWAWSGS